MSPRDRALVDVCEAMERADAATVARAVRREEHGEFVIQGEGSLWVVYLAACGRLGARSSLLQARELVAEHGGRLFVSPPRGALRRVTA